MAEDSTIGSSDDVRQAGNDLYRTGKFEESAVLYQRAAQLAPSDAAPLSNLAAAYFELGDYERCIKTCESALDLIHVGSGSAVAARLSEQSASSSIYGRPRLLRTVCTLITSSSNNCQLAKTGRCWSIVSTDSARSAERTAMKPYILSLSLSCLATSQ